MEDKNKPLPTENESVYMFEKGILLLDSSAIPPMLYVETRNQLKMVKKTTGRTEYFKLTK